VRQIGWFLTAGTSFTYNQKSSKRKAHWPDLSQDFGLGGLISFGLFCFGVPMPKRKGISKKIRFEVFKRDSFTCQYCGRSAPEVVLHLDHIHPVSKDGEEDVLNYLTACNDCNAGKGARLLSDNSEIIKQKQQLDDLQARREQIEMMLEWREGLKSLNSDTIDIAVAAFDAASPGWSTNENGRKSISRLVKTFGLQAVLDAIDVAAEQYIRCGKDGKATSDSVDLAFQKLGGICRLSSQPDWKRELYYLRGILRKRLEYFNDWQGFQLLEDAYNEGVPMTELDWIARNVSSWTRFKAEIEDSVKHARRERKQKEKEDNGG
jgi:hypothetical protein